MPVCEDNPLLIHPLSAPEQQAEAGEPVSGGGHHHQDFCILRSGPADEGSEEDRYRIWR